MEQAAASVGLPKGTQMLSQDLVNVVDRYQILAEDVVPQVDRFIRYEDLDFQPLVTLMDSLQQVQQTNDVNYRWPESRAETFQITSSAISAANAGANQTVTVKGSVVVGQELNHGSTHQTFIVTGVQTPTTDSTSPTGVSQVINIMRRPFSLAALPITGSPTLRVMAVRTLTGGYYPISKGSLPVYHNNYTQLNTLSVAITETEKDIEQWYGPQFPKDVREQSQQFKGNNERVLWYGVAESTVMSLTNEDGNTSTGSLYSTQGIDDRIQTHRTPYTNLDKATILSWIANHVAASRNSGPKEQLWVAGPDAMQGINEIGENQFVALPGIEELGLDVKVFKAWGDRRYVIVEEREFYGDGITPTDDSGSIYKLNPDNLMIRHLKSHYMMTKTTSIPNRDMDSLVFRTEGGIQMAHEQQAAKLFKLQ